MRTLRFGWAVALLGAGMAQASPVWIRAQLPQLSVYSDAPQRQVTNFALQYAAFQYAFNTLVAPDGRRCPPSTIILFKKIKTLQGYASSNAAMSADSVNSLTSSFDGNSTTALALDYDTSEALLTVCEDYSTWMLDQLGLYVPLSVRQGVGEYFSTFELDGSECVLGGDDSRYRQPLDHNPEMSWPDFFDVTPESKEYGLFGHATTGVYYSQSWELMHTVFSAPAAGQSRERFRRLIGLLYASPSTLDAVAKFFDTRPNELGMAIHQVSRSRTFRMPFDRTGAEGAMRIEAAPESDVRAELFELLETHDRLAAEVQLDRARALNPHSPVVQVSLAHLAFMNGDALAAIQNMRNAIADGTHDGDAYYYAASARLNDAIGEGRLAIASGGDAAVQAIQELHRSLELRPGTSREYLELGRAYLAAPLVTPSAIADLTPGLSDSRIAGPLSYYIGILDRRLRDPAAARTVFQRIAADPKTGEKLKAAAQAQLNAIAGVARPAVRPTEAPADDYVPTEHHHHKDPPYLLQDITMRVGSQHWNEFRGYLSGLTQKVQDQFEAPGAPDSAPFHGQIGIPILLRSDGTAADVDGQDAPAGTSPVLIAACRKAVKSAQPFGEWESGMTDSMGDAQHVVVLFNF
jgi:hypothetical protein